MAGVLIFLVIIIIFSSNTSYAVTMAAGHQEIFASVEDRIFTPPEAMDMGSITLKIEPYKIDTKIIQDVCSLPVYVTNITDIDIDVDVDIVQMEQNLNGTPVMKYDDSDWIGRWIIHVEPKMFVLQREQIRKVKIIIHKPDKIDKGIYAGVCFKAYPSAGRYNTRPVKHWVFVMISFPEIAEHKDGKIEDIILTRDTSGKAIIISSIFHNIGDIHLTPTGKVVISDVSGNNIANMSIISGVVLPGYSRSLQAKWVPRRLAIGTYTVNTIVMIDDKKAISRKTIFFVPQPDVILQARGNIIEVSTLDAVQDKIVSFNILFVNTGDMKFAPISQIKIMDTHGKVVACTRRSIGVITPGCSKEVKMMLDKNLLQGRYTGIVQVEFMDVVLDKQMIELVVKEKGYCVYGELVKFFIPQVCTGEVVSTDIVVKNTGNVVICPEGILEIRNIHRDVVFTKIIHKLSINPGDTQRLRIMLPVYRFPEGEYKGYIYLFLGGDRLLKDETEFIVVK